jgi:hypothetical protein
MMDEALRKKSIITNTKKNGTETESYLLLYSDWVSLSRILQLTVVCEKRVVERVKLVKLMDG